MQGLLKLSGLIDRMNHGIGKAMTWLVLIVVVVSAGNAMVRYAFNWSSNSLLEIQWYLFSAIVMFSAGYVLLKNEHIRIDVIVGRFSQRAQNWVDVFGLIVFLLPMMLITLYFSWPSFTNAWAQRRDVGQRRGPDTLAGAPYAAGGLLPAGCCRAFPNSSSASPSSRAPAPTRCTRKKAPRQKRNWRPKSSNTRWHPRWPTSCT